jgi:F-type H+-transporting ATPase subunit delta
MKTTVARRYAKALIELGREDGLYEQYGRELRTIIPVFKGNLELSRTLLNPMYRLEERLNLMNSVAEGMKLSKVVSRFLAILVETRKISLLDDIGEAYSRLEDDLAGRIRATVEAAIDPKDEMIGDIKDKLKAITGKDVILAFRKDPTLIGGLVLKIGNTVLDGSVRTQLELMKEKIMEGVV